MTKKLGFFFLILLFFQFTSGQNQPKADQILSDLLNSIKTSAIKTSFKLIITEKDNPHPQSTEGVFTLKGNKFFLEMDAMKVWFDGKTQWSYVHQNNEVSITEPSEKELTGTNPMAILSGFKSKCIIRFSTKIKSEQNHCIELIPKVKNNEFTKIEVQMNKTTGNLFSIRIESKKGNTTSLILTNFQKGIVVPENLFTFNQNKYKGISINDLR